jgi:hypothetical protein
MGDGAARQSQVAPEWLRETRAEISQFIKEHGILQSDFGKQIGYSGTVISQWLRCKYDGNNEDIGRSAQKWLKAQKAGEGDSFRAVTTQPDAAPTESSSPTAEVEDDGSTELRNEMLEYTKEHRISQHEVCAWIGYSTAVISQWKRGLYRGNTADIDKLVRMWMQAHSHARETGRSIAPGPGRKGREVLSMPSSQATAPADVRMAPSQGAPTGAAGHGNALVAEANATLASASESEVCTAQRVDSADAAADPKAKTKRKRRSLSKFMRWGKAEEQALLKLVDDDGAKDWSEKAKALGTGRSGSGLHQHWLIMQGKTDAAAAGPANKKHQDGNADSATAGTATEKQQDQAQQPNLRPSQCVEDSDDLSPSRPATVSSASSDVAESIDDAPPSGTGEVAASTASAEVNADGKTSRPEHANSGNTSSAGFPQPKRQKRLASVDKFYELAASRRPTARKAEVVDPS